MPHLFILAIIALYKSKYIPGEIRLENFIYSINATLPIFAMMILGKFLVKTKIINENFAKAADKFVFYAALPALVFGGVHHLNGRLAQRLGEELQIFGIAARAQYDQRVAVFVDGRPIILVLAFELA